MTGIATGDRPAIASSLSAVLTAIDGWDVLAAGVVVTDVHGVLASRGAVDEPSRVASVSKLLTAYALGVAVEEEAVTLDDPAGPPGATLRHLLAHTAGYGFESDAPVVCAPATRRVYSNRGIEEAADHLAAAGGLPFTEYLTEAVLEPLDLTATTPQGSPAFGFHSTVTDLAAFGRELLAPTVLHPTTLDAFVEVAFPGLSGIVPGVGRFDPCDWGLGFERNFGRAGHWAGTRVSPHAFGHFGGSGSFLWVDPTRGVAVACLTQQPFGPWGMQVWPPLCDALVAVLDGGR